MRFDKATIALVPLTAANTLDMAMRAFRGHFRPIAAAWLAVTLPTCAAVYAILDAAELNFLVGVIAFALASSVYGAYLAAGMGGATFGEPFTFATAWRHVFARRGRIFWTALGLRVLEVLSLFVCLVPGIWVPVRFGFTVEQRVLKDIGERRNDRGVSELIRNATSDLLTRWAIVALFCFFVWVSISATFDLASELLFLRPIIRGRLAVDYTLFDKPDLYFAYVFRLFWNDPAVITFLVATALAVYPLARLAWFFCLMDLRVRQDCWDIELQIEQEVERLEATQPPSFNREPTASAESSRGSG